MQELKFEPVKARITSTATAKGQLTYDRSLPSTLIFQVGATGATSYLPLDLFGQEAADMILTIRGEYTSAVAAAERLDNDVVTAIELEFVGALTELVPIAADLAAGRRRKARRQDGPIPWPTPIELAIVAGIGALLGVAACVGWKLAALLIGAF